MSATYKPVTLNCACWRHIINILLTLLSRSVWENLDLGRVYRPYCVRSVLTTSVKILPYRPPARLIRAKYRLLFSLESSRAEVKQRPRSPGGCFKPTYIPLPLPAILIFIWTNQRAPSRCICCINYSVDYRFHVFFPGN